MDWQPIETAPTCDILLFFPAKPPNQFKRGGKVAMYKVGRAGEVPRKATHWMPLPKPPTAETSQN